LLGVIGEGDAERGRVGVLRAARHRLVVRLVAGVVGAGAAAGDDEAVGAEVGVGYPLAVGVDDDELELDDDEETARALLRRNLALFDLDRTNEGDELGRV
jgi:hypothetical protein